MKFKHTQLPIGIICVILGFIVTLQIRSVNYNNNRAMQLKNSDTRLEEAGNLQNINQELQKRVDELQKEVDFYRENLGEDGNLKGIIQQMEKAETMAGLTSLKGPGITVLMSDSKAKNTNGAPENYIIHDEDIRKVINELFAAGAEAISVNGERIIVNTAIRCVGPVIAINNNRYSSPYTIKAIGDKKTLSAALNQRDGVIDVLKNLWKIEIDIKEEDNVDIPQYKGTIDFKHAMPERGGNNQ